VSVEVDRPEGAKLAGQIALSVRYDQESCEFEPVRYFYYGPCNPFTDNVTKLPSAILQELWRVSITEQPSVGQAPELLVPSAS